MKITLSKSQWEQLKKTANDLGLYEFDTPKSKVISENSKKEFDAILNEFGKSLEVWRTKYVHYGSKDTASIDSQIKYIRNFIINEIH